MEINVLRHATKSGAPGERPSIFWRYNGYMCIVIANNKSMYVSIYWKHKKFFKYIYEVDSSNNQKGEM